MIAFSEPRIVGRTVRIGRRWHALAWVIGRRVATCRIDPIGFTDRSRARRRLERVRDAVARWS